MKLCDKLLQTNMGHEHVVPESLTNHKAGSVKHRDKQTHTQCTEHRDPLIVSKLQLQSGGLRNSFSSLVCATTNTALEK